ncbi:MAG: FAD:protein FMN transferase [Clostridia bacterium]|nr:FAD:protein FMN transferase [Clostridia bacterium]
MKVKNFISRKKTYLVLAVSILVLLSISFLRYSHSHTEPFSQTTTAMGSFVTQTILTKSGKPEDVANSVAKSIQDLEAQISWRIPDSYVAKINRADKSDKISLNDECFDILKKSLAISEKTEGAFEVTILPLSSLWDFSGERIDLPDKKLLRDAISKVGYKNIVLNEEDKTVQNLAEAALLDLGSVGKGAACDLAIKEYSEKNLDYAIISVGGSVGLYGQKITQQPFNIAIRDPFSKVKSSSFATVKLTSGCVSTSGSYEKSLDINGKSYHHILTPKTGYPIETDLVSVTVWHNSGTIADLLSTACFILGREKSLPILQEYNAQGIFVDKNKNVYISKELSDKFIITNNAYKICS